MQLLAKGINLNNESDVRKFGHLSYINVSLYCIKTTYLFIAKFYGF